MTSAPCPVNGLDLEELAATARAVQDRPELATVRLRAQNRWVSGAHTRSVTQDPVAGHRRIPHARAFVFDSDLPLALGGHDHGPAPAEYLLYALAADLTATVAAVAAERRIGLVGLGTDVEATLDARTPLGLAAISPAYLQLHATVTIEADIAPQTMRRVVDTARGRSTVLASLAVPVTFDVEPIVHEAPRGSSASTKKV